MASETQDFAGQFPSRAAQRRARATGPAAAGCLIALCGLLCAGCDHAASSPQPNAGSRVPDPPDRAPGQVVGPTPRPAVAFPDVAEALGVKFVYRNDEQADKFSILESLGGGVAASDFDRDNRIDLIFAGGGKYGPEREIHGEPTGVFRQLDGSFIDVSERCGMAAAQFYTHGVNAGDFDDDGFPDMLVTGYGGIQLFHNCGDGTFENVTTVSGLDDPWWSSSSAWGDLNGDGILDLYVAHYVNWSWENDPPCQSATHERDICSPRRFQGLKDALFFGNGDGTFRDAAQAAGLVAGGNGLGAMTVDLDLDGDLDVYVSNDTIANFLYQNDGRGHLTEIGVSSGAGLSEMGHGDGSMGIDAADFNQDGWPDLWVANFERETFALYRHSGSMNFLHISGITGVSAIGSGYVGWGTAFTDFDHDGDEDVFVSNGHVIRHPANAPLEQLPVLFDNEDGKRFENLAGRIPGYLSEAHMGRGVALCDFDNDGLQEFAISQTNQPAALLHNETETKNHWLGLSLIGEAGSRSAIGAFVRLRTPERSQLRLAKGGGSYASTRDPRMVFGLGEPADEVTVEVHWPSGAVQVLPSLGVDRYWLVREGAQPIPAAH